MENKTIWRRVKVWRVHYFYSSERSGARRKGKFNEGQRCCDTMVVQKWGQLKSDLDHMPCKMIMVLDSYNEILFIIQMLFITICLLLLSQLQGQEFLQNAPISFKLNGLTSYVPSSGGVAIQGYSLTVGFSRYSWLGTNIVTKAWCSWHWLLQPTTTLWYSKEQLLQVQEYTV